ncbi:MAG: glycosyltransferase family 2 protein [Phycisphaerales bacterium]|nr:glycosyltransferase family 2 protein [Phycisphaerales bacterium]
MPMSMMPMLSVIQSGPSSDLRYRSTVSYQASVSQAGAAFVPCHHSRIAPSTSLGRAVTEGMLVGPIVPPGNLRTPVPQAAVVIVNFNAGAMLGDAVASVVEEVDRVVVVDNASRDGSAEEVARRWRGDRRVAVIARGDNGGFAVACNEGVRALGWGSGASGAADHGEDAVLFLNPDARCLPGCVASLLGELRSDPRIGAVGGMLVDAAGRELGGARRSAPSPWPAFVRATGLWRLSHRWPRAFPDFHQMHAQVPSGPQDVGSVSGACLMVRRRAFEQVQGFDEQYFLHCEDLDLCARVLEAGWRIRFAPGARAWHAVRGTTGGRTWATEWHKHRGMVRYYRRHLGGSHAAPVRWFISCAVWARFAVVGPCSIVSSLQRRARRAQSVAPTRLEPAPCLGTTLSCRHGCASSSPPLRP